MKRRLLAAVLTATLAGALAWVPLTAPAPAVAAAADSPAVPAAVDYPGNPATEALLVAGEDRRMIDVRAIANVARWTGANQFKPYRLVTGNTHTLVLTARGSDYTFQDLLQLSPRTLVRQPDGTYLLSENIVIAQGATLNLQSDDGLVLHLASSSDFFVSIVTMGGSLTIEGTAEQPIDISSWDPDSGTRDSETSDGRAYIRVVGGHAGFAFVNFHDLGFWSGVTGGVSLTGTELPTESTQALDTDPETPVAATIYGTEIVPAGEEVDTLDLAPELDGYSYVSARITAATFSDNAFGLFITSAAGVDIRDAEFTGNLVDGLVFHRNVTDSRIANSTSSDNAGDGFVLSRATTGILLNSLTAAGNGGDGITVDGRALAGGPSATGKSMTVYGNNEISNSTVTGNGRYGIDLIGGTNLTVSGNTVGDQAMGIVVRGGTDTVVVKNNLVEGSERQGISLRDSVMNATVQGNTVVGGNIGIYLRDAVGLVDRNVVEQVNNHGVTLIGSAGMTTVSNNTVSGSGPSGIDVARAAESVVANNDAVEWRSTKPLDVILRGIFQPLTVLWLVLGLLMLISMVTGFRRKETGIVDPYDNLKPLSALSTGVMTPQQLDGPSLDRTGRHGPGDDRPDGQNLLTTGVDR